MRQDMPKVTTEQERHNSDADNPSSLQERLASRNLKGRLVQEEYGWDIDRPLLKKKPIGNPHYSDEKEFTDVLNPIKGWMFKQVGRKWDDVYSEMCSTMDRRTVSGNHVFEHALRWVEQNPFWDEEGNPYQRPQYDRYTSGYKRLESSVRWPQFYVDRSGVLQVAPTRPSYRALKRLERKDKNNLIVDGRMLARHDNGCWYEITPGEELLSWARDSPSFEVLRRYYYSASPWKAFDGKKVLSRQLSKAELKRYRLLNTPQV